MYILLDGQVDFSLDMKNNELSQEEVAQLSKDLKDKDLLNRLHKYKHSHKLCPTDKANN